MSLVAYGSSDDSDSEETSTSAAPESRVGAGGLFSMLPAPKNPASAGGNYHGPSKETKASPAAGDSTSNEDLDPQPSKGGLFSSLPKPRKRTEPVKITVPEIQRRDVSTNLVGSALCLYTLAPVLYNQVIMNNFCISCP